VSHESRHIDRFPDRASVESAERCGVPDPHPSVAYSVIWRFLLTTRAARFLPPFAGRAARFLSNKQGTGKPWPQPPFCNSLCMIKQL
jgi:hypothetical protein